MSIDIRKPVYLALNDPKWFEKLFIGGLFYWIFHIINSLLGVFDYLINKNLDISTIYEVSLLFSGFFKFYALFLYILLAAIPIGYVLQSVHNHVNGNNILLPDWNDKFYLYFINGLKFFFVKLIYFFVLSFLIFIITLLGFAVYNLSINNSFFAYSSVFIFLTVATLLILSYCILLPMIFISFAENFKIAEAFNIRKYIRIIYNNIYDYLLCDLAVFGLVILQFIISVFLICTCVGILLIPFLYLPFLLIIMNLFSQIYLNYKSSCNKESS